MKKKLLQFEPALYIIIVIVHLFPVIILTPFVTLDGPAHLYNAALMKNLLSENPGVIDRFFEFNSFPHPNWSGHFILMLLLYLIPPLIAEKIFLLLVLIIGATGFRKLVSVIEPSAIWLSWMYFPFMLSFPFLLGFYNFSFALSLLPWWLSIWIQQHHKKMTVKIFIIVFSGMLILYFSHLVVFLLAGLFAGTISLTDRSITTQKHAVYRELRFLFLTSLPGLLLTAIFLLSAGAAGYRGEISRLPLMQLLSDIAYSRMFIAYDYSSERLLTFAFTVLMVFLTAAAVLNRSIHRLQRTFLWLFFSSLLMIFILPDSMASGGILSVRLIQWFFLAWCLWLVTLRIPLNIQMISAFLAVLFSIGMLKIHWPVQLQLHKSAGEYISAVTTLEEGTVLLPLNYSGNWLHSNLACYQGAVKKLVVLDNYEATHDLFPLLWKKGMDPELHMGNHVSSNHPCVRISSSEKETGIAVKYISEWGYQPGNDDSCDAAVRRQIDSLYFPLQQEPGSSLRIYKKISTAK